MNQADTRSKTKVFSVSGLTRLIKTTLEAHVGEVWLEGELSNVRRPASGHYYFTIKDEAAQIAGVLFRGSQRGMTGEPRDGMLVRVFGEITVYERGGNYQILVRRLEEAGQGSMQARFEALKEKLFREGLFDPTRKKPLPRLPRHIGIVTSETGAAIRDILNVVSRRFPNLHILLAPVKVQGPGAADEIAEAIDLLNRRGGLDVMIVGRGGGSLEDLWCFNEEIVARAIARSTIPVISAVGHEIDFTISDFVADLRAPTPSAAAELVVGRKDEFTETLRGISDRLTRTLRQRVLEAHHRLLTVSRSYVFREPANLVRQYVQRLDGQDLRLRHAVATIVGDRKHGLDERSVRLRHAMERQHQRHREILARYDARLKALNPLAVLERGYSVTMDGDGRVVRSVVGLKPGQGLTTRLAEGTVNSEITATAPLPGPAAGHEKERRS